MNSLRRFAPVGAVLSIVAVVVFAVGAQSALTLNAVEPVPSCVKPSSNVTHVQQVNYAQCLQARTEALLSNAHAPAPTVTETVTATVTATPGPSPTETSSPTPTPTPTPPTGTDPKGWDLTTTNVGLTPHGLSCASLPAYSGPGQIASGTTISGKRFTVPVNVSAGGILIEKSCFQPTSILGEAIVNGTYPQGDITIRDSEFDGSLIPPATREGAYGFQGGANLYRNYVHDVGIGIAMMSSTNTRDFGGVPKDIVIKNNYVHKLFHYSGAHHEAGTIRDFVKNADNSRTLKWIGNYLQSDSEYVSGGLFIQPTWEPIYNVWLEGNVFAGEGWNLVSGDSTAVNVVRNLHVVDNRFKAGTREWYGPVDANGPGIVEWAENHLYDSTQPEARGTLVAP